MTDGHIQGQGNVLWFEVILFGPVKFHPLSGFQVMRLPLSVCPSYKSSKTSSARFKMVEIFVAVFAPPVSVLVVGERKVCRSLWTAFCR